MYDEISPNGETNSRQSYNQKPRELAVGISAYVSPEILGFQCSLKQRYTDFLVNEILPNGEVLHLTNIPSDPDRKRKRGIAPSVPIGENSSASKKRKAESATEADGQPVPGESNGQTTSQSREDGPVKSSASSISSLKQKAIDSISEEDKKILHNVFGEKTTGFILDLHAAVVAHPHRKARDHQTVQSEPIAEKFKRTEAHVCIRRIFSSKLETLTVQDQDNHSGPGTIISIKAAPPKAAQEDRNDGFQRQRQVWSDLGGEYLHFTLYKENKDTMEVLFFLASQLKLHIKNFSFAGTKDRRGVTVQRIAVHRVRKERIEGLNKLARGWRLGGPWIYQNDGLDLGFLTGNEFSITLRDARFSGEEGDWSNDQRLEHAQNVIKTATHKLAKHGFLNHYGLQRFGTHETGTHITGMRMLKGDLKGAVDSILAYDAALVKEKGRDQNNTKNNSNDDADANAQNKRLPQDDIARAKAIHTFFNTGSSSEALSHYLGNRFQAEKGIITHLGKTDRKTGMKPNQNDYQGALMQIQRNLRLMYVHAYQSYVWNTVAGRRWELFGDKVVGGDLVVIGEKEIEKGAINGNAEKMEEFDEDGEPIIRPSAFAPDAMDGTNGAAPTTFTGGIADDPYVRARPLNEIEARSGRYTIFDIVLPLPGYDVIYPENELGRFYKDFMASESGGNLDPHEMRRAWKDISLSGGYRKMMARPLGDGIESRVVAYALTEAQMVETDLEKIERLEKLSLRAGGEESNESTDAMSRENVGGTEADDTVKDKIAVVLKLQLGSSQYATMALRELTKGGAMAFKPDYSLANR